MPEKKKEAFHFPLLKFSPILTSLKLYFFHDFFILHHKVFFLTIHIFRIYTLVAESYALTSGLERRTNRTLPFHHHFSTLVSASIHVLTPLLFQNLKDKWFGKENKENFGFSMPHQYRELEELLARERATNRRLEKDLTKARAALKGKYRSGTFHLLDIQCSISSCLRSWKVLVGVHI